MRTKLHIKMAVSAFSVLALSLASFGSIPAQADSGRNTNTLVNGGFEQSGTFDSFDYGPGWSYINTQYSQGADNLVVNALPASHSGSKSITVTAGEGQNNTGSIIQTISLPNGTYNLTLSGWTWLYESDTQNNAAWIRGDLYTEPSDHIVGDPGWFGAVGSDTNTGSNGTKWMHVTNTFKNVTVQGGSVSLVVTQRVNGYGSTGHGSALSDGWSLKAHRVK